MNISTEVKIILNLFLNTQVQEQNTFRKSTGVSNILLTHDNFICFLTKCTKIGFLSLSIL